MSVIGKNHNHCGDCKHRRGSAFIWTCAAWPAVLKTMRVSKPRWRSQIAEASSSSYLLSGKSLREEMEDPSTCPCWEAEPPRVRETRARENWFRELRKWWAR